MKNSIEEINKMIDNLVGFSNEQNKLIKNIAEESYQLGWTRAFMKENKIDFNGVIDDKFRLILIRLINGMYAENRDLKIKLNKLSSDTNRTK